MTAFYQVIRPKWFAPLIARKVPHRLGFYVVVFALAVLVSVAGSSAKAQTKNCIIASNDGRNGFRTDEISGCRINTSNGHATFVMNQENRSRSYVAVEPLTTQHLQVASYWLSRIGQIRVPNATNPQRFDPQSFLSEASQATQGYVFVRNKRKGGRAYNVVYITDGVYRSIDFSGTDFTDIPSGFLITR